ncbi:MULTISPECIES: ABC transporter ATP-binding protein [Marinobacter]|mgnify:FL=1|jgi:putative ABC transport system ATP-binding protein|uniref:ABC transport system ATP-binding protein n=1 Tax=Marinobacter salarius TaxID=1420917 RepID=W5YNQ7_9GAMM|nr:MULTISPECIES: ABC transporter ATP-binding protein [Marinobacter]AHI30675.1 methionine ABC transporter ATP-binding protein [Marinobacter salarius]ARM82832.1 ABC transporter ATP-binding protein YtrE [Marinobacter salarius]MAB53102.1 ABC transporter ATP-binding protein [Marinobacter sp.]MCC4283581.1 ABC transporter ATP-binding protein [Marinobacter salarius]MCZ4283743.1 ABC transporter ATP-binding protein [Marinobacter salarius]|tara:strand:- start:750 stop:1490 length:741 start_codon:yes stop_codon:yes gene_type:complete
MPDMTGKTDLHKDSSVTSESSVTPRQTLRISELTFRWDRTQPGIRYPDVTLNSGEHLFLRGPSGSGKSTLLSLMGGLIVPDTGRLELLGTDLAGLTSGQRDRFRADHMGVIFQQFNLVPYLSTLDNVTLPCKLSRKRRARALSSPEAEAKSLLTALGIPQSHWHRRVTTLSVGQQQRVAAARALTGAPELILADEPTSALDSDNRDRFIELLLGLAAEKHSSVVFVSHDKSLAQRFNHQLALEVTP